MDKPNYYEFPTCIHALSAGLHMLNVDPHSITITLPWEEWWKLACALERKYRGIMRYDGRQGQLDDFTYMGIKFVPGRDK